MGESGQIDELLARAAEGDKVSESALLDIVYDELRKIASSMMRNEKPGRTLQTSALVHEAYLRLSRGGTLQLENRALLFASAARAMRRVLVDSARGKQSAKRDGGVRIVFNSSLLGKEADGTRVLAVNAAIERLAQIDARQAQIVELRFFGGLTVEQTAEAMRISQRSVHREWSFARAWLKAEIEGT